MATRRSSSSSFRAAQARGHRQTTSRHVWLAALGLGAVARRQAFGVLDAARGKAEQLRREAGPLASDARDIARGIAITLAEQAAPRLHRIGAKAEACLAPLVNGVTRRAKANHRANATGRASARKPNRKAATRRGAAARKQASARLARKGRG